MYLPIKKYQGGKKMAQIHITLNQDEILQLLLNDRGEAFRQLFQKSLNEILQSASNYGFPMLISCYLLVRMESRMNELTEALNKLCIAFVTLSLLHQRSVHFTPCALRFAPCNRLSSFGHYITIPQCYIRFS